MTQLMVQMECIMTSNIFPAYIQFCAALHYFSLCPQLWVIPATYCCEDTVKMF